MTTRAPGCSAFQARSWSASIESASEQPASRSGISTVFSGERIEAVSAMKWTPQKAIASASVAAAWRESAERVAHVVGDVLDLGHLVVVGQDDGVALRRPARGPPRSAQRSLPGDERVRCGGLDRRELLHEPFLS